MALSEAGLIKSSAVEAGDIAAGAINANTQFAAGVITSHAINTSVSLGGSFFRGNRGAIGQDANKGDIFRINTKAISQNVTFAANENGSTTGRITVNTGVTLTIGTGGTVVIL